MANYYVKNGGNDSADGLSDANAWATISKVNGFSFSTGSCVYFKRGDTWREFPHLIIDWNGTSASSPAIIGAYGTGDKPIFDCSIDMGSSGSWADQGSNHWRWTGAWYNTDIGNLVFGDDTSFGVKKATTAECTMQGHFCAHYTGTIADSSCDYLEMYSTSNPGTYYSGKIRGCIGSVANSQRAGIYCNGRSHVVIQDIDVRYHGLMGVHAVFPVVDVIIERCDIYMIGGGYISYAGSYARAGNGIQIWQGGTDIQVRYNVLDQCYDSGLTTQGGDATYVRHWFHHNVITRTNNHIEMWVETGGTGPVTNWIIANNVCWDAGKEWAHAQRPDPGFGPKNINLRRFGYLTRAVSDCYCVNNVLGPLTDTPGTGAPKHLQLGVFDEYIEGWVIDNNCYYPDYNYVSGNDPTTVYQGSEGPLYQTLDEWKAWTAAHSPSKPMDVHSFSSDPLFVNPTTSDFALQVGSPCLNTGTFISGINTANPPNIGVYEEDGVLTGPTYYVSYTDGDDSRTSTQAQNSSTPWKTLAKINSTSFNPGDSILFKRGDTWYNQYLAITSSMDGSGVGSEVTYGAYGVGAKPIFDYRKTITHGTWTSGAYPNVYYMDYSYSPARLWIDNVETRPAPAEANMGATYTWRYSTSNTDLYIYSTGGNPTATNKVISTARLSTDVSTGAVTITGAQYVILDNLDIRGGNVGLYVIPSGTTPSHHLTFHDCNIGAYSLCGARLRAVTSGSVSNHHVVIDGCTFDGDLPNDPSDVVRYDMDGLSVMACDYLEVYNCTFAHWSHSDVLLRGTDANQPGQGQYQTRYADIHHNTFDNGEGWTAYGRAFDVTSTTVGDCAYNNVHDNTVNHYTVVNQWGGDHNTFQHNTVENIQFTGAYPTTHAGQAFALAGTCIVSGTKGLMEDCTIHGNTFRNCSGYGMDVHGTSTDDSIKQRNIIDGNTFENCGTARSDVAIYIQPDGGTGRILGNTWTNNIIYNTNSTTTIKYRSDTVESTVAQFNSYNGQNNDVITGNTTELPEEPPPSTKLCPFRKG